MMCYLNEEKYMLMVTVLKIRGVNDLRKGRHGRIIPKILATEFITVSAVEPSSGHHDATAHPVNVCIVGI